MDTIDHRSQGNPAVAGISPETARDIEKPDMGQGPPPARRVTAMRWLLHDIPYIVMLLLALLGVVFRLPVTYWVILIPVFGIISIAEGWQHFVTRSERVALVCGVGLNWCALLVAIYLLFNSGVQGVLNANATSLSMMVLLGLGTFVAGVQARVWQIAAVGGILFLAVPALGWLDQSPLLLAAATFVIIALSGLGWWASQWGRGNTAAPAAATGGVKTPR